MIPSLAFVSTLLSAAFLFSQTSVGITLNNETQCCPAPPSLVSVLNFEYTDYQDIDHYHGLEWRGFQGYKRYPGYLTGWAPIPSNYTTALANFTGKGGESVEFGSYYVIGGMLAGVHSLWFKYYETGIKDPGVDTLLVFEGLEGNNPVKTLDVWVNPVDEWHYLCLNFTEPSINDLRITVPECVSRGCQYSNLELDDVWAIRGFFE